MIVFGLIANEPNFSIDLSRTDGLTINNNTLIRFNNHLLFCYYYISYFKP